MSQAHRDTIFLDDAEVLSVETWPGEQYITRVRAPKTARHALPGSFAHVTCDDAVPMRRPLSILRADADEGWVEFLYKIVGHGLGHLAKRRPGERISVLGPIGQPFRPDPERPLALLIGGGVGIPPMVFLAEAMRDAPKASWQPLLLMGSEIPFPCATRPAQVAVDGLPASATHAMTRLDEAGIATRLASAAGLEGAFDGFVPELAERWLEQLSDSERRKVCIYTCGPTVMLRAVADIARRFDVPAQVSLEEYMACAVGGCAGCTVPFYTPETGMAMKRVCVDGPVFDAAAVFFDPKQVASNR